MKKTYFILSLIFGAIAFADVAFAPTYASSGVGTQYGLDGIAMALVSAGFAISSSILK